MVNKQMQKKRF